MKKGKTERETLILNGWTIGDILEGDEGFGPELIKITAVGEERFLCRWNFLKGNGWERESGQTTLSCRTWRRSCAHEQLFDEFPHPALLEAADRLEKIEQQLRIALDGHPDSELWGDNGLIAATMRCVAATNRAAEWSELPDAGLRLRCGELTSQEIRAIRAVLAAILAPTNTPALPPTP